jgi:hypothetical protein
VIMKINTNEILRIDSPVSNPTYDAFRLMLILRIHENRVQHELHPYPNP